MRQTATIAAPRSADPWWNAALAAAALAAMAVLAAASAPAGLDTCLGHSVAWTMAADQSAALQDEPTGRPN
ncbi:MAG: hypothetical protein HY246_01350 [Proteobacteria bacterium]|nr:hypothetical protein [Pseudomonadota bacterium]